jgi:hypothetical protein
MFRHIEIHTAGPLIPDLSHFEVESAIAKLRRYKSLRNDQILAELIEAKTRHYRKSINSLSFIVRKYCLSSGRSLLLYHLQKG